MSDEFESYRYFFVKMALITFLLAAPFLNAAAEGTPDTWTVERIQCVGNAQSNCEQITKEIFLTPGEQLNEAELDNARLRLMATGLYEKVEFRLDKGTGKGRVVLNVEVTEGNPFFSEIRLGTSYIDRTWRQRLGGKVGHRNLFGSGKILELEAETLRAISQPENGHQQIRLQYTDPHLLGSKNYFYSVGAQYLTGFNKSIAYDYEYSFKEFQIDATLGRRIGDFSYIALAYRSIPSSTSTYKFSASSGSYESTYDYVPYNEYSVIFGGNTEDDAYFPTQGSKYHLGLAHSAPYFYTAYLFGRKTWQLSRDSFLTASLGGSDRPNRLPNYNDTFAASIAFSQDISSLRPYARNARWYFEPGLYSYGYRQTVATNFDGGDYFWKPRYGAKLGVRMDAKSLGFVDLYLMATHESEKP